MPTNIKLNIFIPGLIPGYGDLDISNSVPTNIKLNIIITGLISGDGDLLEAGVRRLLGVGEGGVHDIMSSRVE